MRYVILGAIGLLLAACAATGTNTPGPTATLVAKPAATSTILFQDEFSDPQSGWDVTDTADGATGYADGAFVISVLSQDFSLWANPGKSFEDVAVEVETARKAGPLDNEMGVICRYHDVKSFVYGMISADGYYGILQLKSGEPQVLTGNGKLAPAEAIVQGDAINRVQLNCAGDQYTLIVNGIPIASATATGPQGGDVGVLAGTFKTGGAVVGFDNFRVTPSIDVGPIPLFRDDFSNPKSGWDVSQTKNGFTGYREGQYVIRVDAPKYQLWANPSGSFGDVAVTVDAIVTAGPAKNEIGVVCRYQDESNFIYAAISTDGYYGLYEIKDDASTQLNRSGQLTASESIRRSQKELNHLEFVCRGDEYHLIINGTSAERITHAGPPDGDVGLIAGTFDRGGVEVRFDNFVVNRP